MNKKMGRPTLRDKPLSEAEKKRRQRANASIQNEVAKNFGYMPVTVLVNKMQLHAMNELVKAVDGESLTPETTSVIVFKALQSYLENIEELKTPKHSGWPSNHDNLSLTYVHTKLKFLEWERHQCESAQ